MFTLRRVAGSPPPTPEEDAEAEALLATLNAVAEIVVSDHPDWTTRQVYEESKRRILPMFASRES